MASTGSDDELINDDETALDVSRSDTITPDPFLAKVARVPPRGDGPTRVPHPGDKFGRFEVQSELGRGGMGVVYAAVDSTLGREVALKILPASGDSERRKRFLREARSAAAISHSGIATIYDVGEQDGTVFIAMERVRGKTLRAWLDEHRPAPFVDAQRIARQIARTLAKAHELGVVHRDLKPENAMVTDEGDVKLLDFGLAKVLGSNLSAEGATTETEDGRILGTPCYMSPEQARGQPVDARSDVFSFGVMLYELLTGRRPFVASTSVDLLAAITRDDPVPIAQIAPSVPAAVASVVHRCLSKSAANRYANAAEVSRDLEAACELPQELPAKPTVTSVPARTGVARKLVTVTLGLSLMAGLGLYGVKAIAPATSTAAAASAPTNANALALAGGSTPSSSSVQAQQAFRQGMSNFRQGLPWNTYMDRALQLDPSLVAAHVQIAAGHSFGGNTQRARDHYHKARESSVSLDERDRVLLDAIEPLLLRQPSDWAESIRRLSKALDKFPQDTQFWFFRSIATANFDDFGKAKEHLQQAIVLDPDFAQAHHLLALYTAYEGRFDEAARVAENCLQRMPEATLCMDLISRLKLREGSCEAMANVARRMIAASTMRANGELVLAESLAARGQPLATVEQAISQAEQSHLNSALTDVERVKKYYVSKRMLARMLAGDFQGAETQARDLEEYWQSSRLQEERGRVAKALAQIMLETGRMQEAADTALGFLDRRDAWEPNPSAEDIAIAHDATPFLLLTTAETERLSAAERTLRRDGWLRDWELRVTPIARNYLWMHAYASTVNSESEAKDALTALPKYGSLPPFHPETLADAYVGRMYLLANRPIDAIQWLEEATRSCSALQFPFDHTRAHLWLGQAKEATKDTQGACAAYQVVLQRWGQARPTSVSAEQARARSKALKCPV